MKKGVCDVKAKIDYPLLKKTVDVELSDDDIEQVENILNEIESIVDMPTPPELKKKNICKSCAYYDICFI